MKKVTNGAEFKESMRIAALHTGNKFGEVVKGLSIKAFRELVIRSAKDTGYLRSNWSLSVNTNPSETTLTNPDQNGTYAAATFPSTQIGSGDIVHLYNNTSYAMYLEDGTPRMRAQPMVRPTYAYIEREADILAKQLSREKLNV